MKYITLVALVVFQWSCAQNSSSSPDVKQTMAHNEESSVQTAEKHSINWMTMNEAVAAQQKEPKKIMIDFYTNWCGPCKMLTKNTFSNSDVAEYINENYYAVKFNAEGNESVSFKGKDFSNPNYVETKGRGNPHDFPRAFGVNAYPTIVFLDEQSNFIYPLKGYYGPKDIEPTLKVIGSDSYKNISNQKQWDAYMESFTSTFSE